MCLNVFCLFSFLSFPWQRMFDLGKLFCHEHIAHLRGVILMTHHLDKLYAPVKFQNSDARDLRIGCDMLNG